VVVDGKDRPVNKEYNIASIMEGIVLINLHLTTYRLMSGSGRFGTIAEVEVRMLSLLRIWLGVNEVRVILEYNKQWSMLESYSKDVVTHQNKMKLKKTHAALIKNRIPFSKDRSNNDIRTNSFK
jgi:hypothetical protein